MNFSRSIHKKLMKGKAKKEAAAKAKATKKAATDKARSEYKSSLGDADQNTVSGRIKASYGEAGFDDKMAQDVIKGSQFGEAVIGPEGLGRLGESDTLNAMEAQSAELAKGFSSEEMQARKEKGMESIMGSAAAQSRAAQAALARSGVKGQAAGAQLGGIAAAGVEAQGNLERDLTIANREAQMQGLQAQQGVFGLSQGRDQFNIAQAAKEKDIALQAGLGFAQMGSVDRGAEANRQAQIASAKASRQKSCFVEGTLISMADGTKKKIEDIKLTDKLEEGGIVYMVNQAITDGAYKYNDTIVTGGHAVLEDGIWKRVKDANASVYLEGINYVYNLSCENHIIITEDGTVFSDFDETDLGSEISDSESLEALNEEGSELLEGRRRI